MSKYDGESYSPYPQPRPDEVRIVLPAEGVGGFLGTLAGIFRDPEPEPEYRMYKDEQTRQDVFTIGKTITEYAEQENIAAIIYPDAGARLFASAVNSYRRTKRPRQKGPETYFLNPQALSTKEDAIKDAQNYWRAYHRDERSLPEGLLSPQIDELTPARMLEHFIDGSSTEGITDIVSPKQIMELHRIDELKFPFDLLIYQYQDRQVTAALELVKIFAEHADAYATTIKSPQSRTERATTFQDAYPGLMEHQQGNILIADNCIHQGSVMNPLLSTLGDNGFENIKIATITNERNTSNTVPDLVIFDRALHCYPLGRDYLVRKAPPQITAVPVSYDGDQTRLNIHRGYSSDRRRGEIRKIMQEYS